MKKGGNAVGATRKQPLGRASERSIGCRSLDVKAALRAVFLVAVPQEAA